MHSGHNLINKSTQEM